MWRRREEDPPNFAEGLETCRWLGDQWEGSQRCGGGEWWPVAATKLSKQVYPLEKIIKERRPSGGKKCGVWAGKVERASSISEQRIYWMVYRPDGWFLNAVLEKVDEPPCIWIGLFGSSCTMRLSTEEDLKKNKWRHFFIAVGTLHSIGISECSRIHNLTALSN